MTEQPHWPMFRIEDKRYLVLPENRRRVFRRKIPRSSKDILNGWIIEEGPHYTTVVISRYFGKFSVHAVPNNLIHGADPCGLPRKIYDVKVEKELPWL